MWSKIVAIVGSGFGIFAGIKKILKIKKIIGCLRAFYKEGKEVLKEAKDIKPAVEDVLEIAKQIKFGDTSPENIARLEMLARVSVKLAKETNEFIDETDDIIQLFKKLKEDFK